VPLGTIKTYMAYRPQMVWCESESSAEAPNRGHLNSPAVRTSMAEHRGRGNEQPITIDKQFDGRPPRADSAQLIADNSTVPSVAAVIDHAHM
jgi:hypothetical protein